MGYADLVSAIDRNFGGTLSRDRLAAELPTYADVSLFDEKVQWHSHSGISVTIQSLTDWLIDRSRAVGASQAVSDLERYLTTDSIPYRQFVILGGVSPVGELHLADQISLRQIERLPHSDWKERLQAQYQNTEETCRPTVFLEKKTLFPREHLRHGEKPRHFVSDPPGELGDIPLLITALGPYAPLILASWDEPEDWVPDLHRGGCASILDLGWLGERPRKAATDLTGLRHLHQRWLVLPEDCRNRLRIALTRLNSAIRHLDLVESAIDFKIAMEALFLGDRGSDRGELGLTLRLRSARFLGADDASRRDIAKLFKDL